MQVSELMSSEPVTVSPNQTIGDVASLMARSNLGFPAGRRKRPVDRNDHGPGYSAAWSWRGQGAGNAHPRSDEPRRLLLFRR